MMTIREFESTARSRLGTLYDLDEARAIVRLLLEECLSIDHTRLLTIDKDTLLSNDDAARLDHWMSELTHAKPLQYILGYAHFFGQKIAVAPGVLIPRPETEELVELIRLREVPTAPLRLLDVGTGSGCIVCALASLLGKRLSADAMEYSSQAQSIAERNLEVYSHTTGANLCLLSANLFTCLDMEPPQEAYDIIVSNPPYIHPDEAEQMSPQVLDYEPSSALFASRDNPIIYYEAIARLADRGWLAPEGRIYLELNPLYAEATRDRVQEILGSRVSEVELVSDLSGKQRLLYIACL